MSCSLLNASVEETISCRVDAQRRYVGGANPAFRVLGLMSARCMLGSGDRRFSVEHEKTTGIKSLLFGSQPPPIATFQLFNHSAQSRRFLVEWSS